jgi:hypothetical protein
MPRTIDEKAGTESHSESRARILREMRAYLGRHPEATFEQMKKALAIPGLSKPWFMVIKGEVLRGKSGALPRPPTALHFRQSILMRVEILESLDTSSFSPKLREHYRTHVLPMVKRLHPEGPVIHFAFLSDPPCIEIRKMVG